MTLNAILVGLFAGIVHVFSGPDHLASVAPISVRTERPAWFYGLWWGTGHALGVLCIGMLYLFFNELGMIERIAFGAEKVVGLGLIWIGWIGIKTFMGTRVSLSSSSEKLERSRRLVFGFGLLHGSAGAGHLLGLIPIFAMEQLTQALGYLLAYLIGTMVAMVGFAHGINRLSQHLISIKKFNIQQLMFTCGLTTLVVGGVWLII